MAMTRRPVSASISRTVSTVSYKMEFPTFLDESVFVATLMQGVSKGFTHHNYTYLCQYIVHRLASLFISLSQHPQ